MAPEVDVSPLQEPSAPAEYSERVYRPFTPPLPPSSDEEGGHGSMTAAQWAQIKEDAARRASQEAIAKRASLEVPVRPGSQPGAGAGTADGYAPHPPISMRPGTDGARPGSHLGPNAEGFRPASHQGQSSHSVEGSAAATRPTSIDSYRPCSGRQVELSFGSTRSVRDAPVRPSSGQPSEHLGSVVEEEPLAIARISVGSFKGASGSSHPASGTVGEVLAAAEHPPSNSPVARHNTGQSLILGGALHSSLGSRPISTQGAPAASVPGSRPVSTQGTAAAVSAQGSRPASGPSAAAATPSSHSRRSSHLGGAAAAEDPQAAVGQLVQQGTEGARPESGRVEGGREEAQLSHDSPVRFSHHDSAKHAWGE